MQEVYSIFLRKLEDWFATRIEQHEELKSLGADMKVGLEVKQGMPFLGNMFAKMSGYIRSNNTYRNELRLVIRNSFGEFSEAYNNLIIHAEEKLQESNMGKKLLFITDGTDRLQGEDASRFFVDDVYQLKQVRSNFMYCAPIHMLSESGMIRQHFVVERLPMIKLMEKGSTDIKTDALCALRKLIEHRMDLQLFDTEKTLDHLIWHSGGHLRDLIRLLDFALGVTLGRKRIDQTVADEAIKQLSLEYRRLINQEDYALLVKIDSQDKSYTPATKESRQLLYDLALLEYNRYWWQTHPVVRTLAAYQKALKLA